MCGRRERDAQLTVLTQKLHPRIYGNNGQTNADSAKRAAAGASALMGRRRRLQDAWNAGAPLLGRRPEQTAGGGGGGGGEDAGRAAAPPPVAAYVHRRVPYFRAALGALRAARGIGRVPALVVSLDDVSEEMINVVEQARLARREERVWGCQGLVQSRSSRS